MTTGIAIPEFLGVYITTPAPFSVSIPGGIHSLPFIFKAQTQNSHCIRVPQGVTLVKERREERQVSPSFLEQLCHGAALGTNANRETV